MDLIDLLKEKVGKKFIGLNYYHSIEDNDYFEMEIENNEKLYIYCFLRISLGNKLFLTSWDKHYSKKYKKMDNKIYFSENSFDNSLISLTIENTKSYLNSPIKKIVLSESSDLFIYLENDLHIDIIINALYQDYTYYKYSFASGGEYALVFQNNGLKFLRNEVNF